jgi:hypothetical protein
VAWGQAKFLLMCHQVLSLALSLLLLYVSCSSASAPVNSLQRLQVANRDTKIWHLVIKNGY